MLKNCFWCWKKIIDQFRLKFMKLCYNKSWSFSTKSWHNPNNHIKFFWSHCLWLVMTRLVFTGKAVNSITFKELYKYHWIFGPLKNESLIVRVEFSWIVGWRNDCRLDASFATSLEISHFNEPILIKILFLHLNQPYLYIVLVVNKEIY